MMDERTLLVVDDEEVVCQSCRRIFEGQGFHVETSTDSRAGLGLARSKEFAAILLDMKMPDMEGLEFLESLRHERPDVPVVMITGYSSVPTAAAAMRLGAADYIAKPFTPDEISAAIQRLVEMGKISPRALPAPAVAASSIWSAVSDEVVFQSEGWAQLGQDGTAQAGGFLTHDELKSTRSVELPRVGDVVRRGLPLAALLVSDGARRVIPSAVTGEVTAVNEALSSRAAGDWSNPVREGWMVRVRPVDWKEDLEHGGSRRALLATSAQATRSAQCDQLARLGCKVRVAVTADEVLSLARGGSTDVVFVEAGSWGEEGPGLVKRLNGAAPAVKVVVLGDDGKREADYRAQKITYYAVAPFEDNEIVDILAAAFVQPVTQAPVLTGSSVLPRTVNKIRITNRKRERVCLLSTGDVLRADRGLGLQVIQDILGGAFPIQVTYGKKKLEEADVQAALRDSDRVLVLLAEDTGRLPGCLSAGGSSRELTVHGEAASRTRTLLVQPSSSKEGALAFDARTTFAMAEQIVREMTES